MLDYVPVVDGVLEEGYLVGGLVEAEVPIHNTFEIIFEIEADLPSCREPRNEIDGVIGGRDHILEVASL